jgi:uncharacterized membrane protein
VNLEDHPCTPRRRRIVAISTSLAILVGALLRFWKIGALSFWFDEGYTAWAVDHSPREIIRLLGADTAPPLYYLLLHAWSVVFGRSEIALRSFSAVFGVAAIPLVAATARRLLLRPLAVVAATWILVLAYPQTAYSQEARAYEFTAFLSAAIFYCMLRQLERPRWYWLSLLIACAAVSLYCSNFMLLYLAAIVLAAPLIPSPTPLRRRGRDALIATAAIALIYAPWIHTLHSQIQRVNRDFWIPRPTFDSLCQILAQICGVIHMWTWDQYIHRLFLDVSTGIPRAAAAALLIGLICIPIFLRGRDRRVAIALTVISLLPPLAAAAYSVVSPQSIFFFTAFLPSTVFAPLLLVGPIAFGSQRLFKNVLVAAIIFLAGVNLWAFQQERSKEDWRDAAAAVRQMPTVQHRLIVFVANEAQLPFDYYYSLRPGEIETGAPAGFFDIDPPRTQRRVLADSDLDALRRALAAQPYDDIILVDSHAGWLDRQGVAHDGYSDPAALTARYILSVTNPIERIDFPPEPFKHAITIWRCVPAPPASAPSPTH